MKQKEAGIYRSEHFHSAGSVHFLTGVDSSQTSRSGTLCIFPIGPIILQVFQLDFAGGDHRISAFSLFM